MPIFDLGWPRLTLTSFFMKSWCQELHFDIWFADLASILKFDPKWPKFVIWPQTQNFCLEKILRFYRSFWAIFQEKLLNLWFLIKLTSENRNIFRRYLNGRKSKISQLVNSFKSQGKFMLKGTSLPRRRNGSEAWLKENAKSLKSNTEASLKTIFYNRLKMRRCGTPTQLKTHTYKTWKIFAISVFFDFFQKCSRIPNMGKKRTSFQTSAFLIISQFQLKSYLI